MSQSSGKVLALANQLVALADRLDAILDERKSKGISESLAKLQEVANELGRSWSGSFLGYQSRVYYQGLEPTPPGAHFSIEWGFEDFSFGIDIGTKGYWEEYTAKEIEEAIFSKAGVKSLKSQHDLANRAKEAFADAREEFLSIASIALENKPDAFLVRLREAAEKMKILTKLDYARASLPKGQIMSRDSIAVGQGFQTPPHLAVLAEVTALIAAPTRCGELGKTLRRAASHLQNQNENRIERLKGGTKVFLGHGRSVMWKELKEFIQDRLELPWDEFNRVPIAGVTNIARLSEMLDQAVIAFLVMTAEDQQLDGTVRARENVIHEAGLFQGKLGFTRAIVVLEEGCEEFSNIHGLGQIRFPTGKIKAAFEEIRLLLEREGVIEP